eukprot:GHVL01024798.1.p1 GENE.GHVL01024798.1~~GHVL01024798.1.p1  ORF type:complete len:269 (+),score=45.42 GHVL01024798.1:861-1667(+)
MSTLKLQIEEFQTQIFLASHSQENETIIKANSNVLTRFNNQLTSLEDAQNKFLVMPIIPSLNDILPKNVEEYEIDELGCYFLNEQEKLKLSDSVGALLNVSKETFVTFVDMWKEINFKAQQNESLSEAINGLKTFTDAIRVLNDRYWVKWLTNLEGEFVVENVVLEQQKTIPGKKDVYDEYTRLQKKFDAKKASPDIDAHLVGELFKLTGDLVKLRLQMDTSELPEGVAKFLKELDAPWGIPTLNLVTPTVFKWLQEQGLLSKLKITR